MGPRLAMVGAILAWLWPIGLGGKMPVGGDATQFSMGLMAFLGSAFRAGRLPLWNDLWGFGFPALAESQMGVFYPPHLLYAFLPVEKAYATSLVAHTFWAALGAAWAARRFGVSEVGSALSGFVFATCGFFLIHLPHQWGYTVGSWMPWAVGLAWRICTGHGTRRTPWLLSAVLATQTLPGHFQLAFVTEVVVLILAISSGRKAFRNLGVIALALVGMLPLAAMQLWPTLRLARLSDSTRDFDYLSGFAATPVHLVNYVAPSLFHVSPLWRPLAWDAFHTAPEEHLAYIGLIPLFLALMAIRRGWSDTGTRALAVVAALTLLLSLGPYVPGFDLLIRLPGFSFFRGPTRWGLGTALALAILAGRGFDGWRTWPRPGRSLVRFGLMASLAVLVVIGGFELALASSRRDGPAMVASTFDGALKLFPWKGDPPFRSVMAEAYRPQFDVRVQSALARVEGQPPPPPGPTLVNERWHVYRQELGGSAILVASLIVLAALSRKPGAFVAGLLVLTIADALLLARHRPIDFGPVTSLVEQSPVLAKLASLPRGTQTLDNAQNLFLVAGANPVASYRTLDLPSPLGLIAMARAGSPEALRATGVDVRVFNPSEGPIPIGWTLDGPPIRDPSLGGWLYGVDLARAYRLESFTLARPRLPPTRAWLVGSLPPGSDRGMVAPFAILSALRNAVPLPMRSDIPESSEIDVKLAAPDASMVILSRTFDPEWKALWVGPIERRPATVERVLGGWQGIKLPEPGQWTLHLRYEGRAALVGMLASSVAWSIWGMAWFGLRGRKGDST